MSPSARPTLRRVVRWMAIAVIGLAVGGFLVVWSGVYTIAASRGHWAIVEWILQFGMESSVKRRAWLVDAPPPLDDADLYGLGAAHFHRTCSHCHGSPDMPGDLTAKRALPPPPDLTHAAKQWNDKELFWIVKNGIKYTGMPAWVALERDDEVWPVVAFLKTLPGLDRAAYRRLAIGAAEPPAQSGRDIAAVGVLAEAVGACARCHGAEQRRPSSGLVPVLHGQPREFLAAALRAYASGTRRSGIMQPVAAELSPNSIDKLAAYYSALPIPVRESDAAPDAALQQLAAAGDAGAQIPACNGCHGPEALGLYPRLSGQSARYMAHRLRLWKRGLPASTETEALMAPIARLLSDAQIDALAAHFAARPAGAP